jgi:ComF family protein
VSRWGAVFGRILDSVFPSTCCGCGLPGVSFCPECMPRTAVRRLLCGPLVVSAVGPYAGPLRKAILQFKRGRRDTGATLAALLAERAGSRCARDAVFVPVPTVAARRRERGFDQSAILAQACAERSGCPVLLALHQRTNEAQRGRSREARLRARDRFICASPTLVEGMRVVLVDDVITTGSTLRDCAATLQASGAHVSEAIVLAYA